MIAVTAAAAAAAVVVVIIRRRWHGIRRNDVGPNTKFVATLRLRRQHLQLAFRFVLAAVPAVLGIIFCASRQLLRDVHPLVAPQPLVEVENTVLLFRPRDALLATWVKISNKALANFLGGAT